MPPLVVCAHLAAHLFDVGPVLHGGTGPTPLTYQEIAAWQSRTATPLTPWEAATLHRLSHAYLGELQQAEKPGRPAPWHPETQDLNRSGVARSMRNAISGLTKL